MVIHFFLNFGLDFCSYQFLHMPSKFVKMHLVRKNCIRWCGKNVWLPIFSSLLLSCIGLDIFSPFRSCENFHFSPPAILLAMYPLCINNTILRKPCFGWFFFLFLSHFTFSSLFFNTPMTSGNIKIVWYRNCHGND